MAALRLTYAVYISKDGQQWGKPVMQGAMDAGTGVQKLKYDNKETGRFIKLEVLEGKGGFASIAELDIF